MPSIKVSNEDYICDQCNKEIAEGEQYVTHTEGGVFCSHTCADVYDKQFREETERGKEEEEEFEEDEIEDEIGDEDDEE